MDMEGAHLYSLSISYKQGAHLYKVSFRSILTVPWIELGGTVTVNCPQTGYHADIEFLTKPFYGGKRNRISAEVKLNYFFLFLRFFAYKVFLFADFFTE